MKGGHHAQQVARCHVFVRVHLERGHVVWPEDVLQSGGQRGGLGHLAGSRRGWCDRFGGSDRRMHALLRRDSGTLRVCRRSMVRDRYDTGQLGIDAVD